MRTLLYKTFFLRSKTVVTHKMARQILESKTLVVKLHDVRAKWRELGINLEVEGPDLDAIEMNAGNSVQRMLEEMLRKWYNSAAVRTWPQVIEALDRPNIAQRRLAVQLREEHCPEYVLESERNKGVEVKLESKNSVQSN